MITRWLVAVAVALGAAVFAAPGAGAAEPVQMSVTVNGQDAASAGPTNPIRLDPHSPARVQMTLTNNTADVVTVGAVDVSGHVLGLTFFSYHTAVGLTVEPGQTQTLDFELDPSGLDGQATGLINGTVTVTGGDGAVLAETATVTDVRGSLVSVYGLFGLALAILTALAVLDAALGIARRRLHENRWRRATRMLTPGIGIGLVLAFTLSATRVWVPTLDRWLLLAGGFAAGFFLLGYLTPTPDTEDDLDEDFGDEMDEDEEVVEEDERTGRIGEDPTDRFSPSTPAPHRPPDTRPFTDRPTP
ncbi:hypothetical protein SIM91_02530 [Rhodococcus opacus]|uniref:hypothetical protein n=1 Tax=Rhodococcus opacus TaxID=37919 RepID=UPI0007CD71A9|nr:hypothetical protein [Rhodococcus opacus]MDX5962217.1 hypothetical protein [Rhodococcus opacus]NKY74885.1 hypothetical protein [Rhodococcus opacus]CAG7642315.1 hypothetical protein E143388_08382 [Rhodococcus opacus]